MSKKSTKALASATVMSLVLTTALSAAPVKAAAGQVTRTSGSDRYQTASQVAKANWKDGAKEVVLVSGEGYADAVSASVLAKTINAPILLSTAQTLSTDAKEALETLKPEKVYVIGGNASISKEVRDGLKAKYTLVELSGQNRYETNVAVANELVKNHGIKADNVMVVGGEGFSDALSVAPIAATKGQILLLGNNNEDSMKSVVEFVKANKSQVKVIGTKNVINEDMMKLLGTTDRVNGGSDRFNTNLEVLKAFKSDLKADKLYVANATGDGYADALVASALAGKAAAPLVLVDTEGSTSTANAVEYIKTNATKSTDLNVVGGKGVVSEATVKAIDEAVKGSDDHHSATSVKSIKATSLNQIEVVFDGTVDADNAERVSNYQIDGSDLKDTEAVASLGDDDKTLTITLAKAQNQGKELSVKAKKGILSKDKMNTTKEFENKVTFRDTETPTLKSVSVRGNKKVVVEFSEAIKVEKSTELEAAKEMAKNIKIDGQKISNFGLNDENTKIKNAIKVDGESAFWTNKVEFYLDSALESKKHTLKVEKDIFKDAVGFIVAETEKDFTVEKVTGDPKVKEVTCDATGKISVKFDRAMDKSTAWNPDNYELNGKSLGVTRDAFDFDDEDKTVTIDDVEKVEDNANVLTIKDSIKDAFGNNLADDLRENFSKQKDTTKPKVLAADPVDSETIHVRFSKDVKNSYAVDPKNYELKDEDGVDLINKDDVTIKALGEKDTDDTNVYEIKFINNVKLTGQKYTLTIKNIVDTTSDMNTMEEYVDTLKGNDDKDPEVVGDAYQKSGDTNKVVIFFSEEMDRDTLEDKANYKYIDGEDKTKDIPSDVKLEASEDKKSVTVDFGNTTKKVDPNGTTSTHVKKIIVSDVKDLAGNEIPASKELNIKAAGSATTTVKFKENTFTLQNSEEDKEDVIATVQVNTSLDADSLKPTDFDIDGIKPDGAKLVNGNIELRFEGNGGKTEKTNAEKVKELGNSATLTLKGTETTDVAGRIVSSEKSIEVYHNKLVPEIFGEWDAEGKEKKAVTFDVDKETATIHFDMPIETTNFKNNFKFVYNGHEIDVKDAVLQSNGRDIVYTFESGVDLQEGNKIIITALEDNIKITTPEDQNGDDQKYTPSKEDKENNSVTITASETPVVDAKLEAAKKAVATAVSSKTQADIDAARALVVALPDGDAKVQLTKELDDIKVSVQVAHETTVKASMDIGMKTMITVKLSDVANDGKYDILYNGTKLTRLAEGIYSIDVAEDVSKEKAEAGITFAAIK